MGAGEGPAAALEADAVVVGVRAGHVAEALTLARVLREQPSPRARGEQVVVALSSALTWALTPPTGDGRAFSAADEGSRRAARGRRPLWRLSECCCGRRARVWCALIL